MQNMAASLQNRVDEILWLLFINIYKHSKLAFFEFLHALCFCVTVSPNEEDSPLKEPSPLFLSVSLRSMPSLPPRKHSQFCSLELPLWKCFFILLYADMLRTTYCMKRPLDSILQCMIMLDVFIKCVCIYHCRRELPLGS